MSAYYTSLQDLSISDKLDFVKAEAKRLYKLAKKTKPYKSYLNKCARRCGYANYDALYVLFAAELERLRNLGRRDCALRCDDPNKQYFYIHMLEDYQYTFYCHWTGWDSKGYELRAISPINPQYFIRLVRESLKEELYIIHDEDECFRWMFSWKGKALVDSTLAMKSLPTLAKPSRSYSHPRLRDIDLDALENSES